jgi:zinc and cadmium transporter
VVLLWIIASTLSISLLAFVGFFTLYLKEKLLDEVILALIALSAGTLMGSAFLHLIPETMEMTSEAGVFLWLLFGYIFFFFLEKFLLWHHCHKVKHVHTVGYINLISDAVHNFADGLILAASFVTSISLGIVTSVAIALHEVPQEIGDMGVLLYSGFKRKRGLTLNFFVALTTVLGGLTGYLLAGYVEQFKTVLLPLAAGGFIYLSSSDLVPEIRKIESVKKSVVVFLVFLAGISVMWAARLLVY